MEKKPSFKQICQRISVIECFIPHNHFRANISNKYRAFELKVKRFFQNLFLEYFDHLLIRAGVISPHFSCLCRPDLRLLKQSEKGPINSEPWLMANDNEARLHFSLV